jgi:hypothetical protein
VDVDAVSRDQPCLRVVQSDPRGRKDPVQMGGLRQGRTVEEDPELVGLGESGEDGGPEHGDGEDVESVARDECVHGEQT